MLVASCRHDAIIGPGTGPPFLAVVVIVDAPPEVTSRGPYLFHVRELSGTLRVDTTFRASPRDTVIFSVPAATYRVDIGDVPATCGVRDGAAKLVVVPPNTNTSLARFSLDCRPALIITALTDGANPDSAYVATIESDSGAAANRLIEVRGNDTIRVDGLPAGRYTVTLRHVAPNCTVTSDGGERRAVAISPSGGALLAYRVICSEAARRPRIVESSGSHAGGSIGYFVRVVDPDKDVERTFIDVTSCDGKSVLPSGGHLRFGFAGSPAVSGRDTATVIGAYDLGVADSALANRCLLVWAADERGNVSDIVETPLPPSNPAHAPQATSFNGKYDGIRGIQTQFSATDPDGDLLGIFVSYVVRDGLLILPADGVPDHVVFQPPGVLGTTIVELPVGIGYGAWNDYLGVIVYVVDRAGNFTRLEDGDLFR